MSGRSCSGRRDNIFRRIKEYRIQGICTGQKRKYMKTIVAFANTQGGRLLIGIDDKTHEIVGVDSVNLFRLWTVLQTLFRIPASRRLFRILNRRRWTEKYYRCDGGGWEESPILLKIKGQGSRDIYQSGGNIKACISRKD